MSESSHFRAGETWVPLFISRYQLMNALVKLSCQTYANPSSGKERIPQRTLQQRWENVFWPLCSLTPGSESLCVTEKWLWCDSLHMQEAFIKYELGLRPGSRALWGKVWSITLSHQRVYIQQSTGKGNQETAVEHDGCHVGKYEGV